MSSEPARAGCVRDLRELLCFSGIAYCREQYESIGRLPLVKFSTIADSAIRCLHHAVASDRRVMCAALHQSIVRALSNGAAR
jgi:hypothetical protein